MVTIPFFQECPRALGQLSLKSDPGKVLERILSCSGGHRRVAGEEPQVQTQ